MSKSILGSLRRRRSSGKKEADGPAAAGGEAEKQERAATAIQARHRGRQTRKKGFVGEILSGANKVLDTAASYAHGASTAARKSAKRAGVALSSGAPGYDVDAPTLDDRWFTPTAGWPQSVAPSDDDHGTWKPPTALIPTAKDAPALYADGSRVAPPIGELKIEVLEAEGLPKMERFSHSADPYAVVIFESSAARTSVIKSTVTPRWDKTMPRAFRFDVIRPFSCAYIALKDEDLVDADDDIGRVVIELSALTSGVVYDCWFELLRKTYRHTRGRRGRLRLRYSVTFHSSRERLLRYALPKGTGPLGSIPPFLVPMRSSTLVREARFAYFGQGPGHTYNWGVLKSYIAELRATLETLTDAIEAVEDLIFWRGWTCVLSAACCIGVQVLISRPQLVPASIPLTGLFWLNRTRMSRPTILPKPGAPFALPPLNTEAMRDPTRTTIKGKSNKALDGEDSSSSSDDDVAKGKKGSYAYAVAQIEDEIESDLESDLEDATAVNEVADKPARLSSAAINPLAPVLGPIQRALGSVVIHTRSIRRIVTWEDAYMTTWLYAALVVLTLVLLIIPWGLILVIGARLVGVALFGPHMHFVGKWLAKRKAAEAKQEADFQDADPKTKAEILKKVRAEKKAAAAEKLAKSLAHIHNRTPAQKERAAWLDEHKYNLAIRPTRTSGRFRFRSLPILSRSRAYYPESLPRASSKEE